MTLTALTEINYQLGKNIWENLQKAGFFLESERVTVQLVLVTGTLKRKSLLPCFAQA